MSEEKKKKVQVEEPDERGIQSIYSNDIFQTLEEKLHG